MNLIISIVDEHSTFIQFVELQGAHVEKWCSFFSATNFAVSFWSFSVTSALTALAYYKCEDRIYNVFQVDSGPVDTTTTFT